MCCPVVLSYSTAINFNVPVNTMENAPNFLRTPKKDILLYLVREILEK